MDSILCSMGFAEFIESAEFDCDDSEAVFQMVSERIHTAAEDCNIGRIGVKIKIDPTPFSEGVNSNRDIYISEKGYDGEPLSFVFKTYENGTSTIVCSPVKGHEFTDEETIGAQSLSRICYLMFSRARARKMMKMAEIKDMLTGVYNIKGISQYASELIAEDCFHEYVGAFVNIKGFKYLNNRVGARQSDQLIMKYCDKIKNYVGADGAVARLGGDNFLTLMKKAKVEGFIDMMKSIEMELGPFSVRIGSRIGLYQIKKHDGFSTVMNSVSMAIECCSKRSADYIWLTDDIMNRVLREKEISASFSEALDNREFVIYYQPKVDINTNELCGCEALARWKKDGKIISPMDFIPILESEGSVCQLDFYVLESVCMDLRKWIDSGMQPVRVSTNLSRLHFHDEKLAQKIADILKKYDIPGEYIEAELTEMSGFEDIEAMKRFIAEMHKNGIRTSIDDFGTGYSSLNLLKSLDVDIIKLDRTFVINIEKHSHNDEVVVKNIVNMVNELNMDIIAEGVETDEQAEFLKKINCKTVQGFLFDQPMPREEFVKRLSKKKYDKAAK